jgi:hypothetical protein
MGELEEIFTVEDEDSDIDIDNVVVGGAAPAPSRKPGKHAPRQVMNAEDLQEVEQLLEGGTPQGLEMLAEGQSLMADDGDGDEMRAADLFGKHMDENENERNVSWDQVGEKTRIANVPALYRVRPLAAIGPADRMIAEPTGKSVSFRKFRKSMMYDGYPGIQKPTPLAGSLDSELPRDPALLIPKRPNVLVPKRNDRAVKSYTRLPPL